MIGVLVLECNQPWYFPPSSGDPYNPGDVDPEAPNVRMPSFSEVLATFRGPWGALGGLFYLFAYALTSFTIGYFVQIPVIGLWWCLRWLVDRIKGHE
jgi:hypothetical protein